MPQDTALATRVLIITTATVITDLIISLTGQLLCKQKSRPKRRIYGNNVPGVDVLITTCKEDVDIVMDTVRAAATLDWPADKLRVLVSDDGFDIDLKAAVEILGLRFPYVHYYSRPKVPGKHHGYKAGNMNQALRHLASNEFEGRTNEWIAILDADMIPNAKWLRAVIPHVLIDSDIAMVATPQVSHTTIKFVFLLTSSRIFTTFQSMILFTRTLLYNTRPNKAYETKWVQHGAQAVVSCSTVRHGKRSVASLKLPCVTICSSDGH